GRFCAVGDLRGTFSIRDLSTGIELFQTCVADNKKITGLFWEPSRSSPDTLLLFVAVYGGAFSRFEMTRSPDNFTIRETGRYSAPHGVSCACSLPNPTFSETNKTAT